MERALFLLLTLSVCRQGFAVTGGDLQSRYALVGVIAAEREDDKSIVVLKDTRTRRSVTLTEGQALPTDTRWVIGSVYRNAVVLQNGANQVRVTYAGTDLQDTAEEPSSIVEVAPAKKKVIVREPPRSQQTTNYDDRNNAQYIDDLVSNQDELEETAGGEYRSDALTNYERHLEQELLRVRREKQEATADDWGYEGEPEQQDPVFSNLPDGPTYFE